MAAEKIDVLLIGPPKPVIVNGLDARFNLHQVLRRQGPGEILRRDRAARARHRRRRPPRSASTAPSWRGFRSSRSCRPSASATTMSTPQWAGAHGITVTNTPDVLTEEVADTALGLLLCTVREFPQAERYLRAGKWRAERLSAQQGDACATAPSGWSAWAASARRSRAGSRPCRCRWSIIRAGRRRACPTGTIRSSSTWRATSTCCWSSRRAARRPRT